MAENKTRPTDADVIDFLNRAEPERRRVDGLALDEIFREVTGWAPKMWGPTMVGYGSYAYTYKTGHSGTSLATGFSPRKASLSIYIMPGYQDYGDILKDLGKHKLGKSCLYVNKLDDIDIDVLKVLIRRGLDDLDAIWPVTPS